MNRPIYKNDASGSYEVTNILFYSPEKYSVWNLANLANYIYDLHFSHGCVGGYCRFTFYNATDFILDELYLGKTAVMQVVLSNGKVDEYNLSLHHNRTYRTTDGKLSFTALECSYSPKDPKTKSSMPKVPTVLLTADECSRTYKVLEDITVPVDAEKAMQPVTKKLSTLDFAMAYAKSALQAYTWAKVEVAPIDEPLFKYAVTISKK